MSALEFSTQPHDILYIGTNNGNLYLISDTKDITGAAVATTLPTDNLPRGYVSSIEVNPDNADQVMVSFSNYNVESVFYSEDAGQNWTAVSGNLEENAGGSGNGPSVRYLEIMPSGDGTYRYFAGTSVGLFMTTSLDGDNTVWEQQSSDVIGNVIVTAMQSRPIEGKVIAGTHSNGVFSGTYEQAGLVPNIHYSWAEDRRTVTFQGNFAFLDPNPLTYQWLKDDVEIEGATNFEYVATDGGTYQLRLTHSELGSALSNSVTLNLDGIGPDITSISRLNPTDENTSETSVQFQITFNEPGVNVNRGDFSLTGDVTGTVTEVVEENGNPGLVYIANVENLGGSGTLGLTIASATDIEDIAGNAFSGTISSQETYNVQDTSAPAASISRNDPTSEVTEQSEVSFLVTFSEQVDNVDLADFVLASSSPEAAIAEFRPVENGRVFSITVNQILEDGILNLDFASSQNIVDMAGNAFAGDISNEETFNIQNVISSIDEQLLLNVEDITVDANPSSGLFNVAFPNAFNGAFQMQIVDGNGRRIQANEINNYRSGEQVEIDLRNSPDGLYILNVANGRVKGTVKLIKSTSR